jgi:hypothetical protein
VQAKDKSMSQNTESPAENIVDKAVAEGGAYEIIRKRLTDQGQLLTQKVR